MNNLNNVWGDPQEYKGTKIYPFLMKDYKIFEDLISLLLIDKNNISNVEIIKMSYLKFLLLVIPEARDNNNKIIFENVFNRFKKLCKYIFRTERCMVKFENGKIYLDFGNERLDEKDFNKIKEIILNQNAIPVMDEKIHPDLRESIRESMEFLSKKQTYTEGTMEDQIFSYRCKSREKYNDIKNMTIYQFRKEMQRENLIQDYQIYKTAELGGFVSFNKPIPHWTSHIKENDYEDIFMDKNEFENKMNNFIKD